MYFKRYKNKVKRSKFIKTEVNSILFKYIKKNSIVPFYTKLKLCILSSKYKNYSKNTINNYCLYTNRSRSVYSKFKVSRIVFKNFALQGHLPGVYRYSW